MQLVPLPDGFDDIYTVTGCSDESHCGVFTRVPANCASGYHCPGGANADDNTDPTLCNNAPVYQEGGPDGPVLFRSYYRAETHQEATVLQGGVGTKWYVGPSHRLRDCEGGFYYLASVANPGPGDAPTAPGYSAGDGWVDVETMDNVRTITVTAGDGSAIGGGGGH